MRDGHYKTLRFRFFFVCPCVGYPRKQSHAISAGRRPAGAEQIVSTLFSFLRPKYFELHLNMCRFRRWSTAAVAPGPRGQRRPSQRHENGEGTELVGAELDRLFTVHLETALDPLRGGTGKD